MYFAKPGKINTQATIDLALETARAQGITSLVVASVTGETARLLAGFAGNVVCVTHAYGFGDKGVNEMPAPVRQQLQQAGIQVYTASHVLSGVERGISNQAKGMYPAEIMSHTLRMFGQGIKVCVEIAVMAVDAGLVPYGEKIITIGGTGRGADAAAVVTPAHANEIFNFRVHEILCKPL